MPSPVKQDVRENFQGHKVVDIHVDHLSEEVHDLLSDHAGDKLGKKPEHISVKLTPEAVQKLTEAGVEFKDTTEDWINELQSTLDHPDTFCHDDHETCANRSLQSFYNSYQDLNAITSRIKGFVSNSPLARVNVIGKTSEGRDLNLIEIGDSSKPLAFYMCNIHAREWLPSMWCPYLIENLLANGGHRLLDTFSFAIIPTGNPDGFVHSRENNNMWRKTRNINSGSNCIGTDPNRNYDNNFGGRGTSSNPCSDIFRGEEPFSTPETFAINEYSKLHRNRLINWIDFHTFASMWLSPLGYARGTPPAVDYNRMLECMEDASDAIRAVSGLRYQVGGAADLLGPAAGASDDFFYFERDVIYSYTVEGRGNSFQPSSSNIIVNNRELMAGVEAHLDCIARIELGRDASEPLLPASTDGSEISAGGIVGLALVAIAVLVVGVLAVVRKEKTTAGEDGENAVAAQPKQEATL